MSNDQPMEIAADLAATTALLEIAEELGVSPLLDRTEPFTLDDLALASQAPKKEAGKFLQALLASGLVEHTTDSGYFRACAEIADRRYEAGYLSWALNANRPLIENAPEFLRNCDDAIGKYHRDGRRVAISSRWIGTRGFYPTAVSSIIDHQPAKIVDLGAGAGRLLIELLQALPESTGLALDLSSAACAEAEIAASRADLSDRLTVVNRSIESLTEDPSPVQGADVVHAGFVMHDIVADPDVFDAVLRNCRVSLATGGQMVITDGVPYASDPRERAFSALFTYLHGSFMGVQLPTEKQWEEAFRRAGFTEVQCVRHRFPTGRMFLVSG
ncbi:class I SAM-dependent methyltransferase [Embleya sp. NBC_00896]|uniref:class I SAM-dependent methyltransferase n=1 Tax=Embleya sp. NBC_00896 TaxID=2975961 RepID=UPI002F909E45|nr:methyltransferase [Embleya sp. NBC_00896]